MIKFFRRIRQNILIGEIPPAGRAGKTGKYFKYAVGEIILVVIGILIALQINTWNENRLEGIEATNYLKQIKGELLFDWESFNNDLELFQKNMEYLNIVSDGKYDEVDLSLLLHSLTRNLSDKNFGASFNKLTESGSIKHIKSHQLREELQAYYISSTSLYNNLADYHAQYNLENIEGPLLRILRHEKNFRVNSDEVIEKLESENIISMVNWQISFMEVFVPIIESMMNNVDELIILINKETSTGG